MNRLVPLALACSVIACSSGPRIAQDRCESSLKEVGQRAAAGPDSTEYVQIMTALAGAVVLRDIGSDVSDAFLSRTDRNRRSVSLPSEDSSTLSAAICEGLDGYASREIVARKDSIAPRVFSAYDRRVREQHIAFLELAKAEAAVARDSLSQFAVESARLVQESGYFTLESTIILTVRNGTAHHISRAYFRGRAVSEGRQVPWIDEEFNYSIPGGLAPGERKTWRLTPNSFQGDWGNVRVPGSARFEVSVTRINDPNGDPLWGGATFNAADERYLDSLKAVSRSK